MTERREETSSDQHWRASGDRIEYLLDAISANGGAARARAEELVGEVVGLYGEALARIVDLINGNEVLCNQLIADDLVASLLLLNGLHPHGLHRRVSDALEKVRPYLGSHGGDVHLLEIVPDDDGYRVELEFAGSCGSCPSSSVTLELTVEDAIRTAAPEVTSVEAVAAAPDSKTPTPGSVIPAESLLSKIRSGGSRAQWHQVSDIAGLPAGEVGGFTVGGMAVLACRVGDQLYAYRDHCPTCDGTLAQAVLLRGAAGGAVLRCPRCRSHFDPVHAGTGLDDASIHLDPLPLLVRDGVLSLALPAEAVDMPA